MKRNEILARQDHVVYALMVFVAVLGMAWSLWRHTHTPDPAELDARPKNAPALWQSAARK